MVPIDNPKSSSPTQQRLGWKPEGPALIAHIEQGDATHRYIEAIAPEHRPLFDRLHRLVLQSHPQPNLILSYNMPTYKVGKRSFYVGVWKHGVSIYGWRQGKDAAFSSKHPRARTSKGTI